MQALHGWENFYVIVGSSAGALIGLQFVVITLIVGTPAARTLESGSAAFATPTIVQFGAVLLLAAMLNVPWRQINDAAIFWGLLGLAGTIYMVIVARRMRMHAAYKAIAEDWLFYFLLPLAAYASLAVSACAVPFHARGALFAVAVAALLLLFVAIHNAWDAVTYHVYSSHARQQDQR